MLQRNLCLLAVVLLSFCPDNAEILFGPQDTEAKLGENVELHCKGTLGKVEWQHLAIGEPYPKLVYQEGFFYNSDKERFSASKTSDGRNVLIIRGVKSSDAGKFICLENSETPSQIAAELIVFERVPSNVSCAGKYICKPVCNELELSCEMKVSGHYIPSMQWIDSEGGLNTSVQVVANETAISIVKLRANPYVATSYTCRLIYQEIRLISKYNWTYSTLSVTKDTKEVESQKQCKEVMASQSVVMVSVIAAVFITSLVAALIGILIYKKRKLIRKNRNKPERCFSVERSENSRDDAQPLISISTDIGRNSVKDKFVPRTTMNKGSPITGLAAMDDEVFVLTSDGRLVKVFNRYEGTLQRCWSFSGLINLNDVAIVLPTSRSGQDDQKKRVITPVNLGTICRINGK